jgi:predicted HD superfamily hydrolase involved in NAD metabolism
MHRLLEELTAGLAFSGDLKRDITLFLEHHDCPKTAAHCLAVGAQAREIAARFGLDKTQAEQAGWLHDISAVFPNRERLAAACALGVEVLPEEERFPLILHQKLSVIMGREIFGITDEAVLSAAGCHTTLKAGASPLDKAVFTADKIAWDQEGQPPYLPQVLAGLEESLDAAALAYMQYLWERKDSLKVIHPWLKAAYHELAEN